MTSIAILLERLHEKNKQGMSLDEHCTIAQNYSYPAASAIDTGDSSSNTVQTKL